MLKLYGFGNAIGISPFPPSGMLIDNSDEPSYSPVTAPVKISLLLTFLAVAAVPEYSSPFPLNTPSVPRIIDPGPSPKLLPICKVPPGE